MSKAQTDIRSTSYDAASANPFGYQGTIDDALAQIRAEPLNHYTGPSVRSLLLQYLGVDYMGWMDGPSVDMDENPRYGFEPSEEPSKYSLAYALAHFPGSFLHQSIVDRIRNLTDSQLLIFRAARESLFSVEESLARAEAYPFPVPRQARGPDLDAMNFDPRN
jgi:hypothetical protein